MVLTHGPVMENTVFWTWAWNLEEMYCSILNIPVPMAQADWDDVRCGGELMQTYAAALQAHHAKSEPNRRFTMTLLDCGTYGHPVSVSVQALIDSYLAEVVEFPVTGNRSLPRTHSLPNSENLVGPELVVAGIG